MKIQWRIYYKYAAIVSALIVLKEELQTFRIQTEIVPIMEHLFYTTIADEKQLLKLNQVTKCPKKEQEINLVLSDAVPCIYTQNKLGPIIQKIEYNDIDDFFIS